MHINKIIFNVKIMLFNKKSATLSPEALVRIVGALLIILLIILPFYNKVSAAYSNQKYLKSFENFADKINKMSLPRETFLLNLKEKSAIIGFSKNADRYECYNCYIGVQNRPSIIFNKPKDEACSDNACICFCSEFALVEENLDGKQIKSGKCSVKLTCRKIEQGDIVNKVVIKTYSGLLGVGGGEEYWKNGFLFVNGISRANGLRLYSNELNTFIVEKKSNLIGVCNTDMIQFNKNNLNFDGCIKTE